MPDWRCEFQCTVVDKKVCDKLICDLEAINGGKLSPYEGNARSVGEGPAWTAMFDSEYNDELRKTLLKVSKNYSNLTFELTCEDCYEPDNFWREEMRGGRIRFLQGEEIYACNGEACSQQSMKVYSKPSQWHAAKYRSKVTLSHPYYHWTPESPAGTIFSVVGSSIDENGKDSGIYLRIDDGEMLLYFSMKELEEKFEEVVA